MSQEDSTTHELLGNDCGKGRQVGSGKRKAEILVKVYACQSEQNCVILDDDNYRKIDELSIRERTAIYINHATGNIKLVSPEQFKQNQNDFGILGFALMVQIYPMTNQNQENCFALHNNKSDQIQTAEQFIHNTFICIRGTELKQTHYQLKHNDIIKLGKQLYRINLIHKNKQIYNFSWHDKIHLQRTIIYDKICRICYSSDMTHSLDFLISPCNCSGSCAYVHIQCLRQWIKRRLLIRQKDNIKTYQMNLYTCEICKNIFPRAVEISSHFIDLMPIGSEENDCVILENVGERVEKCLYCVDVKHEEGRVIKMGRNQNNDIVFQQLSVSRKHATLHVKEGNIYIQDRNSKFGTFVTFRRSLENCKKVTLMNGRLKFKICAQSSND